MRDAARQNEEDREWARLAKFAVKAENERTARAVLCEIASMSKIASAAILGISRAQYVVRVRHVTLYAMHNITGLSSKRLGDIFNLDHTSVLHAFRRAPKILAESPILTSIYDQVWEKYK